MAVLNNKKQRVSDEIPTSSMADIAFLLLIFFLVTTTFPKDKGLADAAIASVVMPCVCLAIRPMPKRPCKTPSSAGIAR